MNTNTNAQTLNNVGTATIKVSDWLHNLYAINDAERFPASQLADGLERESTLFWADFCVAERFGIGEIRQSLINCNFKSRSYRVLTELAVVLNHKIWEWHEKTERAAADGKPFLAQYCKFVGGMYNDYYEKVLAWVNDNLKDEDASFFWRVMD